MEHFLSCSTILRFTSFRISAGDLSSRYPLPVVRILDPLHPESYRPGFEHGFPTAAGNRFVDRAVFIATKRHGIPLDSVKSVVWVCGNWDGESLRWTATMPAQGDHDKRGWGNPATSEGKTARAQGNGRLNAALAA